MKSIQLNFKLLILLLFILPVFRLTADNIMLISHEEVLAGQNCLISVSIENDDQFLAFQLDVILPDQLSYVVNSAALNPDRSAGHQLSAEVINGNMLRIFAFSLNNLPFIGNSGVVVSFELSAGTQPGVYGLQPIDAIIGDNNAQNIITGVVYGSVTILAPDIEVSSFQLNFGEIPLGQIADRSITIQNTGNQTLLINDISFNSEYFSVIDNYPASIDAGSSAQLTVRFVSVVKGEYLQQMTIVSNDPDEPQLNVTLIATAFAVNELHCGSVFSYSDQQSELTLSINNMEAFSGFQFDLALPSPMTFVAGSLQLSDRKTDHVVYGDMISPTVLRVIAFSVQNNVFSGSEGEIISMSFDVFGTGGYYPLSLSNVIIADTDGTNILSQHYNGWLQVAAPDIHAVNSVDYGEVSVLDTLAKSLTIHNYGSDTLKINELQFTNTAFWIEEDLPINIEVGSSAAIDIYYHHPVKGQHTGLLRIFSNDPDENPFEISLSAYSFAPNYVFIDDILSCPIDTLVASISVTNHEAFIAFDLYLHLPPGLEFLDDPQFTNLSNRAQDHQMYTGMVSSETLRVFSFSQSQSPFLYNEGVVANIGFKVNSLQGNVALPITLSQVILGDVNGLNIVYSWENGSIYLQTLPYVVCSEDINTCLNQEPFLLENGSPSGGIYSGIGVVGNMFYPETAGAGTHQISYTVYDENGCYNICNFNVSVLPLIQCPDNAVVCSTDEPFQLNTAIPEGGLYSGAGVSNGYFDPELAGIGAHSITYCFTDEFGCFDCCEFMIHVVEPPLVTCPDDMEMYMSDQPYMLTGALPFGGVYSGNGVMNDIFYPDAAAIGLNTITYTFTDLCGAFDCMFLIEVLEDPVVILPGDANCDGIIDILDVIAIINLILENDPSPFCPENADINEDEIVDILDAIGIINLILQEP